MSGLEIESICWQYGNREVLNDISLAVAPGTFCALLGPNGAGKTMVSNAAKQSLSLIASNAGLIWQ